MVNAYCRMLGVLCAALLTGCNPAASPPQAVLDAAAPSAEYVIGPGDQLNVFVWRNPELSVQVPVRPDGRISIPLVEDVVATGQTPTGLARELEKRLGKYVQEPVVTVIATAFVGPLTQQVKVIGAVAQPKAIPYRANLSVLDVVIEVGGLSKFAAGNRATVVRSFGDRPQSYPVRLDDLLKDGEMQNNIPMRPGDVLFVPESYF